MLPMGPPPYNFCYQKIQNVQYVALKKLINPTVLFVVWSLVGLLSKSILCIQPTIYFHLAHFSIKKWEVVFVVVFKMFVYECGTYISYDILVE